MTLAGRFYALTFPDAGALTAARAALDGFFDEWAARGHFPLVERSDEHPVLDGTVIADLSDPDAADPEGTHPNTASRITLVRALDPRRTYVLHLSVTDRVRESELEPMLQRVSELLSAR